jgi:hypothetical protein
MAGDILDTRSPSQLYILSGITDVFQFDDIAVLPNITEPS